jgi:hypothetical protein
VTKKPEVEYSEDLSQYRPSTSKYQSEEKSDIADTAEPAAPMRDITAEMDSINRVAIKNNEENAVYDGYTIQVYRGSSRRDAENARYKAGQIFPEMNPSLTYFQPMYKVQMGSFIDRLEANRIFEEVKEEFPQALLLPDKIKLDFSDDDN